jgi:hypothetical protein
MSFGQKHLISCRCVLPQYKYVINSPSHKFIVFSIIDDDDRIKPKFAQCNNCGIIHKIVDICKSEIVPGKEAMTSIVGISDIKSSLSKNLVDILESNDVDLPTWEAVQFIIENKQWGNYVMLSTDHDDDMRTGKYIRILGESLLKVESFLSEKYIKGE